MNQQPVLLNLKDLLFVILKKTGLMVLVGVVLGGAVFGYKSFSNSNSVNVLAEEKLPGESDVAYSQRIQNAKRAEDIIDSIDALNNQIENHRQYVTDSLFMQINAENEAVTTASLVIMVDEDQPAGAGLALASAYMTDITSGEYLSGLAEEWCTNQSYIAELVRAGTDDKNLSVEVNMSGDNGNTEVVPVVVIGPSTEQTEMIMDLIFAEVESKTSELSSSLASHSAVFAGRSSSYTVDGTTRERQVNLTARFETLQKQIETYNKSLDDVASVLGVDKTSLFNYYAYDAANPQGAPSLSGAVKYAVICFVLGVFIVMVIVTMDYLFGKKFTTQAKFFGHFPRVNKIGVAKPSGKRSALFRLIDRRSGDDDGLSSENSKKLIAANVKNLTNGMNSVLFTGTADTENVRKLVEDLGIKADAKGSFFDDPSNLESVSGYDGVIIVEQRGHSDLRLITEELRLIANTDTRLIGAIII